MLSSGAVICEREDVTGSADTDPRYKVQASHTPCVEPDGFPLNPCVKGVGTSQTIALWL